MAGDIMNRYKPHIQPSGIAEHRFRCEFMRKDDDIVQSGYGDTPKQAYESAQRNVDSCVRGNALLHRIMGNG